MRLSTIISILIIVCNLVPAKGQVIDTLCTGNTIGNYGVTNNPGSTYNWSCSGGSLMSPNGFNTITVRWEDVPGIYTLKVYEIDVNGCPADTVISKVLVKEGPNVFIKGPNKICEGDYVLLIAYGAEKYLWSTGDTSAAIYVHPTTSQEYVVYGYNSCGIDSAVHKISVSSNPEADFEFSPKTPFVHENVYFIHTGNGGTQFKWYLNYNYLFSNSPNPIYTFSEGGRKFITLIAINNDGCADSITKYIDVLSEHIVHVPNAFTPNGDGVNDFFFAKGINIDEFDLFLFDRWGEQIWETNSIYEGWDGTHMGMDCQEGVYPWIIYYQGEGGTPQYITGHVTLYR